jgi:hypothetical protein
LVLLGVVLSHRCSGWWCLSRGCEAPGLGYSMECWPSGYLWSQYWKPLGAATESPDMSRARLRGWVVTDVPRYPGYKTPTVTLEPFVEQVAAAVRSTGGRIDTHMLLRVSSPDRVTTMGRRGMTGVVTCGPESRSTTRVGMYLHYKHV